MSIIALDIETTGLPEKKSFYEYYPPEDIAKYDRCRILSIAIVSDNYKKYSIITPTGSFDIDPVAENLHKISKDDTFCKGISLQDFFSDEDVVLLLQNADIIVGHNIDFDMNVLQSELIRNNIISIHDIIKDKNTYCTMKNGKQVLKLEKNPRLNELYNLLFSTSNPNPHNALDDAASALRCFHSLQLR